jgi:hypothetical protein
MVTADPLGNAVPLATAMPPGITAIGVTVNAGLAAAAEADGVPAGSADQDATAATVRAAISRRRNFLPCNM